MVFGEVFQQEPEFVEGFEGQEVGVVNDGDDDFAFGVEVAGLGNEAGLTFVVVAGGFELHGVAEEAQETRPIASASTVAVSRMR